MKLPLYVHVVQGGDVLVCDADRKIMCAWTSTPETEKRAKVLAKRINSDWRYWLFGKQPYLYTREDWLFERSTA